MMRKKDNNKTPPTIDNKNSRGTITKIAIEASVETETVEAKECISRDDLKLRMKVVNRVMLKDKIKTIMSKILTQ